VDALPLPLVDFPEVSIGDDLETLAGGYDLGGGHRALQVAGVDPVELVARQRLGRFPSLPATLAVQGDVGLALGEAGLIPFGGAVTHQQDECDRRSSGVDVLDQIA
jgi:hypothetical protein